MLVSQEDISTMILGKVAGCGRLVRSQIDCQGSTNGKAADDMYPCMHASPSTAHVLLEWAQYLPGVQPMPFVAASSTSGSSSTASTSSPGQWCARNIARLPPPSPIQSARRVCAGSPVAELRCARHARCTSSCQLPMTAAAARAHLSAKCIGRALTRRLAMSPELVDPAPPYIWGWHMLHTGKQHIHAR